MKKINSKLKSTSKSNFISPLPTKKSISETYPKFSQSSNIQQIIPQKRKKRKNKLKFDKSKKIQGKIFNMLFEASPKSKFWIPAFFQYLVILFQTSFIFSKYLSETYYQHLPKNLQNKSSILDPDSIFNKISDFFDILSLTRKMTKEIIYINVLVYIFVLSIILVTLKKFQIFAKFFKIEIKELQQNFLIRSISVLLINYDFFFFYINMITINSFLCREIIIEQKVGFEKGTNFLDSSYEPEFHERIESGRKSIFIQKRVNFLNNEIQCQSLHHYCITSLCLVLIAINFLLKIYSSRLMTFIPDFEVFCTRINNKDVFIDLLLILILIMKNIFITYFKEKHELYLILNGSYLVILFICYLTLRNNYIFHDKRFAKLKSFQIIYLISLTIMIVIAKQIKLPLIDRETSTIIFFLILISFFLKLEQNLNTYEHGDFSKKILNIKNGEIKFSTILGLYNRVCVYVHHWINEKEDSTKNIEIKETQFILALLMKKHRKKCSRIECFCNNSKLFKRTSNLHFLKKKLFESDQLVFESDQLVFESLYLMSELFENYLFRERSPHPQVFHTYVYFLVNYLGDPKKALKILEKIVIKTQQTEKNKNITEIEIYALLEQIASLGKKNLNSGVLGLAKYSNSLLRLQNRDKKKIFLDLSRCYSYLKSFELLKTNIRKSFDLKLNFIKILSKKNEIECRDIVEISKKFFKMKQKIDLKFEILENLTKMKFSPLYLIYAFYLIEISEEFKKGNKVRKKYNQIYKFKNFNFIFEKKIRKKFSRMMIILAEIGEKAGTQVFKYSTSNCIKLLGWRNEEMLEKPIELITPKPIKTIHHHLFTKIWEKSIFFFLILEGILSSMTKENKKIPVLNKKGNLIISYMNIRLTNTIDNSLKVISSIGFEKYFQENCIMILDFEGKIIELSNKASRCFEKGKYLYEYNKKFEKINNSLNVVYEEMLQMKKLSENSFENLTQNIQRVNSWLIFMKAKEINTYEIKGKRRKFTIEGRFEGYMAHKLNIFVKYFVIRKIDSKSFHFERITPEFESDEIKTLKNLDKCLKKKYKIEENYSENETGSKDQIDENILNFQEEEKEGYEEISDSEFDLKNDDNKSDQESVNLLRLRKKTPFRKLSKSFSKRRKLQNLKKSLKIFEFLDFKIKRITKKKSLKIFIILFSSLIIINVYFLSTIKQKKKAAFSIIKENALTVDIYSWLIWAPIYTSLSMDILRSLKQGWIDPSVSNTFLKEETYMKKWTQKMRRTAGYLISPYNDIDKQARKASDSYREKWINSEVYMTHSLFTSTFEPKEILMSKRSSALFIQGFSQYIKIRDYENDTNIPMLESNENRTQDPMEEILRMNYLGDQNRVYFELSHDFFMFITGVAQKYENSLLVDCGILAVINIGLLGGLVGYFMVEIKKMKKIYKKIFDVKIRCVEKELTIFESNRKSLSLLLLEEREIKQKRNEGKMSFKEKIKDKSLIRKYHDKISVNFDRFNFGLMKVILVIFLIACLSQISFIMIQLYLKPKANQVTNLLKVYILGSGLWSSLSMVHVFFFETIVFNNTVPCWRGKKVFDCYQGTRNYLSELLKNNITESANYDLKNYSIEYSDRLTKVIYFS